MAAWLKRLIGAAAPAAPPPGRAAAPAAGGSDALLPNPVPKPVPGPLPAPPGGAVQVPLVSPLGGLAGFEFTLTATTQARLRSRGDPVAQSAHTIALLAGMRPTVQAGRVALTRLPTEALERDAVRALLAGVHLVQDRTDAAAPGASATSTLRRYGARLGREVAAGANAYPEAGELDFLVLRRGPGGVDALGEQLERARSAQPNLPVLVSGVEDFDELERVLALDVWLACAPATSRRHMANSAPPRPAITHICQVLSQLRVRQHASEVARRLGADVTLSYRLLRCVNSPAFGLSRSVASIEEAVLLVGHAGLHRWLCIALLASADGRKVSRALQEVSLARARLLEGLAALAGRDPPQALFTMGLLSILDVLLQRPMAESLTPLHLPENALQALLHARGPWWDYLALAQDLEAARHDQVQARAQEFGGLDAVLRLSSEAWAWAADVSRSLHA